MNKTFDTTSRTIPDESRRNQQIKNKEKNLESIDFQGFN
jgi:hypothetical protein